MNLKVKKWIAMLCALITCISMNGGPIWASDSSATAYINNKTVDISGKKSIAAGYGYAVTYMKGNLKWERNGIYGYFTGTTGVKMLEGTEGMYVTPLKMEHYDYFSVFGIGTATISGGSSGSISVSFARTTQTYSYTCKKKTSLTNKVTYRGGCAICTYSMSVSCASSLFWSDFNLRLTSGEN